MVDNSNWVESANMGILVSESETTEWQPHKRKNISQKTPGIKINTPGLLTPGPILVDLK